ncbi:MAG: DUF805 domain-containing protein [Candidatus Contendobacter sp.]|nr:DUF805 domain-containing protein [Candidatus Contendobacter sp.]MDG4559269.1 DUF805 domain-containing protein [Candidatus Contendobacter sp.]
MTSPSPYQPPRGAIAPTAPTRYGEIHPFSHRGRLGRVRYIGYSVGLGLLINLLAAGWGALAALSGNQEEMMGPFAVGGLIFLAVLAVAFSVLLAIQRLHDFDASGWWSAFALVPLANLVLYLTLLIMPGTQGANRFGDPPPPNTTGVILLALVVPLILVIGIVAAIAIPAYQNYAESARAASQRASSAQPR